jgi:dolichyl-phosphate-mannose--protein O-mannosyl transferase
MPPVPTRASVLEDPWDDGGSAPGSRTGTILAEPGEDLDDGPDWLGTPSLATPDDDSERRPDPADDVVPVGAVPAIRPPVPVRRRLTPPMPSDALRGWVVTGILTLIGGILRFWHLGYRTDGGTPLFDEKYYAVQAAEMIRNGGVEDNQAYGVIVHPPLGKQIIAIGEMLFGYNPIGWRVASAVAGTLCILLIVRVTRRMTRSTLLGAIAGVLLICDGVSHVMSRLALLDVFSELFVLAAFACLIADRDQVRSRLSRSLSDGTSTDFLATGVPLGARWWRFGAGLSLGLATAVKWNGAYWIVAFLLLVLVWDTLARRDIGVRRPIVAMFRRDFLPGVWSIAAVPVITYLGAYWAWFRSENAYGRHMVDSSNPVVASLKSLVSMTKEMLKTTAGILTPLNPADRHPWESKPLAWPMSTRPVLVYLSGGSGTTGCGDGHTDCVKRIFIVGTPALWWLSLFVLGWALWRCIARTDWRYAAILVAYGAGYLPWFAIWDRQMYFFYMVSVAPFLVIGITLVLGDILGRARDRVEKRLSSYAVVAIFVGLVVANFIWLWPILNGDAITPARLVAETWLPSWG